MSVRSNRDWHRPEGDHEDHCPVDDTVLMYPATDIGLSALVNCWNTRVTQPEATKPAQELSAVLDEEWLDLWCPEALRISPETASALRLLLSHAERDIRAALASPADALVAGDRVDAERYRHLRELMQFSTPPNKPTTMKLRAALPAPEHQPHRDWMGEHFDASVDRTVDADIRACLTAEEIPEFDASRAAIQAQKDGHDA